MHDFTVIILRHTVNLDSDRGIKWEFRTAALQGNELACIQLLDIYISTNTKWFTEFIATLITEGLFPGYSGKDQYFAKNCKRCLAEICPSETPQYYVDLSLYPL